MPDFDAIAAEFGDDPGAPPPGAGLHHSGPLWRWKSPNSDAPAAWFFVTLDGHTAAALRAASVPRKGFGSIRVKVAIGSSEFATSVFPAKEVSGFLLPVKASVRKKEGLGEGDMVDVELRLS